MRKEWSERRRRGSKASSLDFRRRPSTFGLDSPSLYFRSTFLVLQINMLLKVSLINSQLKLGTPSWKFTGLLGIFSQMGRPPPPCWEKFPNNPIISYEGVLHLEKRTQLSSWIEAKLHLRGVFLLDTTDTSQQITLLHWASNFLGDWCNKPFSCLSIECSSQQIIFC